MASAEDVVLPYLNDVRQSGDSLRATCPLCNHRRTFLFNTSRGVFICFNDICGQKGGLPKLLYLLGLGPREISARLEHVVLKDPPTLSEKIKKLESGKVLPEYILGAYPLAPVALLREGFTEEILREHQVGFDHRAGRITFPIRDHIGRLVAVSGRAHPTGYPRYLVYEQEFRKVFPGYKADNRRHLYGIDSVYASKYIDPNNADPIIIVEGYKACLWLRQHGFMTTVALQGSSLTPSQEIMLHRLRGEKIIFLDNEPGKHQSTKGRGCAALGIAYKLRKTSRVTLAEYPRHQKGGSPDDLNFSELQQAILNKTSILQRRLRDGLL